MSRKQGLVLTKLSTTWIIFLYHTCSVLVSLGFLHFPVVGNYLQWKYWYIPAFILSMYLPCAAVHLANSNSLCWERNHHFINAIIHLVCSWKKAITNSICWESKSLSVSYRTTLFLHQDGSRNGITHNWFLFPVHAGVHLVPTISYYWYIVSAGSL